jgi:hypothetical protein
MREFLTKFCDKFDIFVPQPEREINNDKKIDEFTMVLKYGTKYMKYQDLHLT